MNTEKVIESMQYFSPLEMKIIDLIAKGTEAERIAEITRLQLCGVYRRIEIINKRLQEVASYV